MKLLANILLTLPWLAVWIIGTTASLLSLLFDLIERAAFSLFNWLDTLLEERP